MRRKTRRRRILIAVGVAVCTVVSGVGAIAASIYAYGGRTSERPAQAAIVLGAAIRGEEPSPVFQERINHAIVLYRTGHVQKLLFTGGVGGGRSLAESEAASCYALRQGVPPSDILTETRSHTTLENLRYAWEAATRHGIDTFLIVSDPLHMKRAMTMATDLGLHAEPSPTPTTRYRTARSQCDFLIRETYYYLDYRLRHLL